METLGDYSKTDVKETRRDDFVLGVIWWREISNTESNLAKKKKSRYCLDQLKQLSGSQKGF